MSDDTPPCTAVAAEIHAAFAFKMEHGGLYDQMLAGRVFQPKGPALPDEEIAVIQRSINVQLDEYEAAIKAARAWIRGWFSRRPKGFRCKHGSAE
jgi:hypothetical protein